MQFDLELHRTPDTTTANDNSASSSSHKPHQPSTLIIDHVQREPNVE